MEINLQIKDTLYYSDLMYEIRKLAKFEQEQNEFVEQRIAKRTESIAENPETGPYSLSTFELELFQIIRGISKKAGVPFKSLSAISKYPELVNEVLAELEVKKNELSNSDTNNLTNNRPVLTKKKTPPRNTGNK